MLSGYADRIYVLFDPDTAGEKAIERAATAAELKLDLRVLRLPEDPADWLLEHSPEEFAEVERLRARSGVRYKTHRCSYQRNKCHGALQGSSPGEEYDPGDQDLPTARLSAWLRNLSVLAPTSCSRHGRLLPRPVPRRGSWPGRPSNGSRRRCAYPYSRQARPHSPLLEVGIEIQNLQPLTLRTEDFRDPGPNLHLAERTRGQRPRCRAFRRKGQAADGPDRCPRLPGGEALPFRDLSARSLATAGHTEPRTEQARDYGLRPEGCSAVGDPTSQTGPAFILRSLKRRAPNRIIHSRNIPL